MKRELLIIVFLCLLLLVGCEGLNKEPEFFMTTQELLDEYVENEISASVDYDDKYVQITGVIKSIDGDKDSVTIKLYDDVQCVFNDNIEDLVDLKPYNKVILNGRINGLSDSFISSKILITKCELISIISEIDVSTTAVDYGNIIIPESKHKIIEITGVVYGFDLWLTSEVQFELESRYEHLDIEFEKDFDFGDIERGDTITIVGIFVMKESFLGDHLQIIGYKITNIVEGE